MEDKIKKDEIFFNTSNGYSVFVKNCIEHDKIWDNIKFLEKLKEVTYFRWKIIWYSTSIENLLNANIEFILFNYKDKNSELFQNLFLRTNNLTFFSKWNIFKELCKLSEKTKDYYDKKIITEINNIIELRNHIAHWYLIYDYKEENFYLEYVDRGKVVNKLITDSYIEESIKKLYECINKINILVFWKNTTKKELRLIETERIVKNIKFN